MLHTFSTYFVIFAASRVIDAVLPAACSANFRWDDCGMPPKPVMYYWKPGSRCEVGIWRGCLPNLNMFPDEYECVATCIFAERASPYHYHSFNEIPVSTEDESDDEIIDASNSTTGVGEANETTTAAGGSSEADNSSATTVNGDSGGNNTAGGATTTTTAASAATE